MGFSRQEYWSGLPFPFPEDLPHPGIEPWSPALEADALTLILAFFKATFLFLSLSLKFLKLEAEWLLLGLKKKKKLVGTIINYVAFL